MASSVVTTTSPDNTVGAPAESFTLAGVTCDKCGPAVSAAHRISKDKHELFFCTHDTREMASKLLEQGFAIAPALPSFV